MRDSAQTSFDFAGLPLTWRPSLMPDVRTLLCGSICVGSIVQVKGGWRSKLGHMGDIVVVGERASEVEAKVLLEAAVRGAIAGREAEWQTTRLKGVEKHSLLVGDVLIAVLFPWHAEIQAWPEAVQHRPLGIREGRCFVEAEAKLRLAA